MRTSKWTALAAVGVGLVMMVGLRAEEKIPGGKKQMRARTHAHPMAFREPAEAQAQLALIGLHVRDGRPDEQMPALHMCSQQNPDMWQCTLYEGKGRDARLVGIEYVITEKALRELPDDEKALWHQHVYEVTSGQLAALGAPAAEEKEVMKTLVGTYGKTWHTWDTMRGDRVPMGRPMLMMSFTRDGQARADLVEQRDREFGLSTAELKKRRADITSPTVIAGVDKGEGGRSCMAPASMERKPVRGEGETVPAPAPERR